MTWRVDMESAKQGFNHDTQIAVIMNEIHNIKGILDEIKETLKESKETYASAERVERLEKIVYGGTGFILLGVLAAVLSLVIK